MRFFFLLISFLSLTSLVTKASPADTSRIKDYLGKMVIVMDDESKEDSILIYAQLAMSSALADQQLDFFQDQLLIKGPAVYEYGYIESAVAVFDLGIQLAKRSPVKDYQRLARLYYHRSRSHMLYGEYQAGKPSLDSCHLYHILAGDTLSPAIGDTYNLLGISNEAFKNFDLAVSYQQKALQLFTNFQDSAKIARSFGNLGNAYRSMGLGNRALEYYQKALTIRQQILPSGHPLIARILLNMGNAAKDKGDFQQAIRSYNTALPIFIRQAGEQHPFVGGIHFNLGSVYRQTGRMAEAEDYLQKALQIFQGQKRRQLHQEALIYRALANVQIDLGNLQEGIDYRKKELTLHKEVQAENYPELAIAYDNLGLDFFTLQQYDSCFYYFKQAEVIFQSVEGYEWQLAKLYNNLADAHLANQSFAEAKAFTDKALAIQREMAGKQHPLIAYSQNTLAKIALQEGKADRALLLAHQGVIANHEAFEHPEELLQNPAEGYFRHDYYFESILLKAQALEALDRRQDANRQYRDADRLLDATKDRLVSRQDQLNQARNSYRLAKAAIHNNLELAEGATGRNYLELAFYYSEKTKANVLAQSITANNAKYFAGLPPELIEQSEQLQADINYYNLQLSKKEFPPERITEFRQGLFRVRQQYQALIKTFEQDYPLYYELRYSNVVPQAKAIQFALPEDQALISYFTTDSVMYSFLLTREQVEVQQTPIDEGFRQQVDLLIQSLALQLEEDFAENAALLYPQLMPFQLQETIKHLIIVPDGSLVKIPFDALLTKEVNLEEELDFSALPYLIRDYQISYSPSAALTYQQKTTSSQLRAGQLEQIMAFAPVFEDQPAARQQILPQESQRSFTLGGDYIAPLPASRDELQAIQSVFQDQKLPAQVFIGAQATEAQLKRTGIADSKYLHIATHGFVNESHPDLSGLVFYPDSTSADDGVLASGEVYNLRLKAELVVLSACETGIGKLTTGEGILGLSRAFLYAGAENLVVSLWKVSDYSTAQLMADFYRLHLGDNNDRYARALRNAKLKLIEGGDYAHPYYWSAFVLIGE